MDEKTAKRPYTEKMRDSNRRWDSANLDRISVAFKRGEKEIIQEHARSVGESMNAFIHRAVFSQIDRDNATDAAPPALSPVSQAEQKTETLEDIISRRRAEADAERAKANGPSELMKEALAVGQKRKEAADRRREAARERDAAFREAMAQEKPAVEVPNVGAMMAGLGASLSERAQTEDEETEENAE